MSDEPSPILLTSDDYTAVYFPEVVEIALEFMPRLETTPGVTFDGKYMSVKASNGEDITWVISAVDYEHAICLFTRSIPLDR